jgi:hypothetical protein
MALPWHTLREPSAYRWGFLFLSLQGNLTIHDPCAFPLVNPQRLLLPVKVTASEVGDFAHAQAAAQPK